MFWGGAWKVYQFFVVNTINMFCAQPPKWLFVYSVFVGCTSPSPDSHWPHVNYFVNHHISFNCCGFVYPGDQIELGEAVRGCQQRSVGKTDECISNSLTMGATVRHTNGCMDDAIMSVHLIQSYSNRLSYQFQTCRNDNCSSRKATICLIFHLIA